MGNDIKPANDPNVSPALDNVPEALPVEPVVEPAAVAVEPVAPVEPAQGQVNEPAPVLPDADPVVPEVPETLEVPATNPAYIPESYGTFMEAANSVLTAKGINTDALARSIEAADGVVTEEIRTILVDKLGAAEATVMISGFETEYSNASTSISTEANKVYDVVGGKEEWNKIAEWTKTPEAGLTPEAKDAYNSMLQQGGVQAELAAKAIKEAYMASPGFTQDPNLMPADSNANPAVTMETISRSVYVSEKQKAIRENDGVAVAKLEERARFTKENNKDQWYGTRFSG